MSVFKDFAGIPPITVKGATDSVATLSASITAQGPIIIAGIIVRLTQMKDPRFMITGCIEAG